jgi:hypothetical protein
VRWPVPPRRRPQGVRRLLFASPSSGAPVPAGQKLEFWSVVIGGAILILSGSLLLSLRPDLQQTNRGVQ